MPAFGMITAVQDGEDLRFLTNGVDAAASRTRSIVRLVRTLLPMIQPRPDRFIVIMQHWDYPFHDVASIAYGKQRGQAPAVRLIPDAFFFDSEGYEELRLSNLPDWTDRQDVVFWRGSATGCTIAAAGQPSQTLEQVPRIAMCLALKDHPKTDVAIMNAWTQPVPRELGIQRLTSWGIYRPAIPMIEHARYRYLIDIDGFANAWSFFEKLLLGSCVLKVGSPFEQWFYNDIVEWEHFVPVREDLSDLVEKIEWCLSNVDASRSIAERGQAFALSNTLEVGRQIGVQAIQDCCIPF
jgi:hypothetical protein